MQPMNLLGFLLIIADVCFFIERVNHVASMQWYWRERKCKYQYAPLLKPTNHRSSSRLSHFVTVKGMSSIADAHEFQYAFKKYIRQYELLTICVDFKLVQFLFLFQLHRV